MNIKIEYTTSVVVDARWRSIVVTALAELNESGKKCTIKEVLLIDGEHPTKYMSRTGVKRQNYNGRYIVERETGVIKIVSKCTKLED